MRNRYLETLELEPGASETDIKSAYRRLSKKYHPDLKKATSSKEKFIEITEAYDFLLDVGPKPHDEFVSYDYDPYQQEFEERRRQARKRAEEQARYKAHNSKKMDLFMTVFNWIFFLFSALFFLDLLLPKKVENVVVYGNNIRWVYKGKIDGVEKWEPSTSWFRLHTSKGDVIIESEQAQTVKELKAGILRKSHIYGLNTRFQKSHNGVLYENAGPLFSYFLFVPISLFVTAFIALASRRRSVLWNFGGAGFMLLPIFLILVLVYGS